MTFMHYYFGFTLMLIILAWLLFLLFGQITVKKLRKNLMTKNFLGIEFMSGWDIFNVAHALCRPNFLNKFFKERKKNKLIIKVFYLEKGLIVEHTTQFDRVLAHVFYFTFIFAGVALLVGIGLDVFFFDDS